LIYNQESKESLFFGAVTSRRFLTILRLQVEALRGEPRIASYTVDSTGTTEIQSAYLPHAPTGEDRIPLSVPVNPGASITSERLMFAAGDNYHAQLEAYGAAIRKLHHARISASNLMGWWSWTAYYLNLTDSAALANAQWLSTHLKKFGYDYLHIDAGYENAPGEYTSIDRSRFPRGMEELIRDISRLGLK